MTNMKLLIELSNGPNNESRTIENNISASKSIILGRTSFPDCNLGPRVSRKQLELTIHIADIPHSEPEIYVEKIGSSPSRHNDRELSKARVRLASGDKLTMDNYELLISWTQEHDSFHHSSLDLEQTQVADFPSQVHSFLRTFDDPSTVVRKRVSIEDFSDESGDIVGSDFDEVEILDVKNGKSCATTNTDEDVIDLETHSNSSEEAIESSGKRRSAKRSRGGRTAYGCFAKHMRPTLKQEYPNMKATDITKLLKGRFQALSEDERQEWQDEANK